jgi:hypothetical protein
MPTDKSVFVWLFFLSLVVTTLVGLVLYGHLGSERNLYTIVGFETHAEQGASRDCTKHQCLNDHCSCTSSTARETCILSCTAYTMKYRAVGICRLMNTRDQTSLTVRHETNYIYALPEQALSHQFSSESIGPGEYFLLHPKAVTMGYCVQSDLTRATTTTESFQEKRHRLRVSTLVFGGISTVLFFVVVILSARQYLSTA